MLFQEHLKQLKREEREGGEYFKAMRDGSTFSSLRPKVKSASFPLPVLCRAWVSRSEVTRSSEMSKRHPPTEKRIPVRKKDLLGDGSVRKQLVSAGDGGKWLNEALSVFVVTCVQLDDSQHTHTIYHKNKYITIISDTVNLMQSVRIGFSGLRGQNASA